MVNANAASGKNIWIAASDGDIERVKELIEVHGMSPNAEDDNTYTPMHAAASYAHLDLLDYLISKGGDINHADSDGETPLFTVESVEVAKWMIERGAKYDVRNNDGETVAEFLFEDNPDVAMYLQTLIQPLTSEAISAALAATNSAATAGTAQPSAYQTEALSSSIADDLISQTGEIMRDAEAQGYNPDERLRAVVSQALMDGWRRNRDQAAMEGVQEEQAAEEQDSKRSRRD
ncbi:hypothetical protein NliqN6_2447 [Naganishia liquefaciens]|uniref:Ankyrin repeat domain-containing protein n=1 Tax=Naganishia liquefaciens TaxID=104408 RepID=A0A8H3TRU4_9TREE|nr:hypothetical protein NliqN6_2447 [Naganishia liquefaciens]